MTDKRWFQIMNNLLYPAVLGTLLYTFVDTTVPSIGLDDPGLWGACALFVLFIFDYAHSSSETVKENYDGKKFLFDFLIISFLFLAGKDVLNDSVLPNIDYVWWLFLSKLAAVGWEFSERKDRQKSNAGKALARPMPIIGIETDIALLIAYGFLCGIAMAQLNWWLWATAICMVVDAGFYWKYSFK